MNLNNFVKRNSLLDSAVTTVIPVVAVVQLVQRPVKPVKVMVVSPVQFTDLKFWGHLSCMVMLSRDLIGQGEARAVITM